MTPAQAGVIARWTYPAPYAMYSFSGTAEDERELLNGEYYACLDAADMLIGYFCFGASARIPALEADAYRAQKAYADIGLGMRPEFCGHGLSGGFLRAGTRFALSALYACALRLTVAAFNERAIRAYRAAGFMPQGEITHARSGEKFLLMILNP